MRCKCVKKTSNLLLFLLFRFGSGTIIPPAARFSDVGNANDHRRLLTSNTFELQPHRPQEVRTLGRPYTKAAKLIHHQIQV